MAAFFLRTVTDVSLCSGPVLEAGPWLGSNPWAAPNSAVPWSSGLQMVQDRGDDGVGPAASPGHSPYLLLRLSSPLPLH